MAQILRAKNWQEFQHYKDRAPPWIKLHKQLLDDFDFQRLPVASRALAPMLWLLASESSDGVIVHDLERIAFRLRQTEKEIEGALKPLISAGFFYFEHDASAVIADCTRDACPETEVEADSMSGKPDDATEILDYLNAKAGKHFRSVKATLDPIRARLKESTPDELRAVIDDRVKAWAADDAMSKYLRPETLFRASKFAGYFGNLGTQPEGSADPAPWETGI